MGLHLEPSNLLRPGLGQPGQDGACRIGLDDLLGCPEAVRWGSGLYPDHLVDREAELAQSTHIRLLGRRHQVQATALARESREGRAEQAPFADRCLRRQEFGQAAPRPASAGQLGIERSKARGDHGRSLPADLGAAPERLCHMRWQGPGLWCTRAHADCWVQVGRVVRAERKGEGGGQGAGQ